MYRFSGNEYSPVHDKRMAEWYDQVQSPQPRDWTLPGGWPWKASFEHRAMLMPGDLLILWGKVVSKEIKSGMGIVDLEIGMKNQDGLWREGQIVF